MKRLQKIIHKKTRLIVGLMSGTSHDGIDAALVKIQNLRTGPKISLLQHKSISYPKKLREKIAAAFIGTTRDICALNFELGEEFAAAALAVIKEANMQPAEIDLIASHGQTIYHIPPTAKSNGSTLQIGEACVIAERTGIITVADFRPRDIAVGGHGAPLVPLADYFLFKQKNAVRAVQNIGGIANVTVVPEKLSEVIAFDTGPGNALIDEAVKIITHGKKAFDRNASFASQGVVDLQLLHELNSHPYFAKKPPKSTGRELFGQQMAQTIFNSYSGNKNDLLATFTKFTASSIFKAYQKFIFPHYKIDEVILCGGGSKNPLLVEHLRDEFKEHAKVCMLEEFGIPSAAKEALSFAVLANEAISGRAGNVPSATGASKPVVLGKISL